MKTTNGGESWSKNISSTAQKIQDITFSDSLTYYFVAQELSYSKAYKSTDAGITWISMNVNDQMKFSLRKIDFLPGGSFGFMLWDIIIVGYYKTSDNGNVWSDYYSFDQDYSIIASCIAPGNKWYLTTTSLFGAAILVIDGAVPVELESFEAKLNLKNIMLQWTTVTEKNNKGFIVQRKFNNGDWNELGFINGNGTSTELHSYNFSDNLSESGKYSFRLKQIDFNGNIEYSKEVVTYLSIPEKYSLEQNYPNPWNPTTTIRYQVTINTLVTIKLFDALGREVSTLVNETKSAGNYEVTLNGKNLRSGVYYYQMKSGNFIETKKLILLK